MIRSTLSRLASLVCLFICLFSIQDLHAGVIYDKAFSGQEKQTGVLLEWSTSSEDENALFVIEKSEDGEEFVSIGAIGGAGASEQIKDYSFLDFNIYGKYLLYRLKQLDADGTVTYSKALLVNINSEHSFMVGKMTNEKTSNDFALTIDMKVDSNLEYHLKNDKGETIIKENSQFEKGLNDLIIGMEGAESGKYTLVVKVGKEEEIMTFEKMASKNKEVTAKKE